MKNLITYLKTLWSSGGNSQSSDVGYDCRSTVVRPSFDRRSSLLKFVSVLVLILTIGVGQMWGAEYELVTSTSGLVAGAHYVIGNGSSGSVKFMSTTSESNYRHETSAQTVTNNKVTATNDMLVLTLGGSTGAWTLYTYNYAGTAGYLASAASGKNNYCRVLASSTTGTITFSSNQAIINLNPHTSRTKLQYNSQNTRFACYSSDQAAIYLYKEVTGGGCDKKVSLATSLSNCTATFTPSGPVKTCSATASDRQVSVSITPTTGYALTSGPTVSGIASATISGSGPYTIQLPQNGNGTLTLSATCTAISVTGVSLNKSSTTIVEGNTETLTATIAPSNALDKAVTWSSGTPGVATVNSSGVVTAVSAGNAIITVTTHDGNFTATCAVTVTAVPKDHFIDEVQGTIIADKTSAYNFSSVTISDKATATSGTCEQVHYHFVGWITKAKYDAGTAIGDGDIQSGNKTPNNSTYYAVWAKQGAGGGGASVGTTLWAETFNHYAANDYPSNKGTGSGTTIYGGASITYSESNSANVKAYAEGSTYAGGDGSELYIKSGSTWTIAGIKTGNAATISLTFKSNNTNQSISVSTSGATISGSNKSYTITPNGASTITVVFTASGGNTRIDDVSMTVATTSVSYEDYIAKCCTPWDPPTLTYSVPSGWKFGDSDINATIGGGTTHGSTTWTSSDESVLTVNSSGQIHAVGAGTATVTVTWAGDATYCEKSRTSATITVNGDVAVSFNANGGSLGTTSQSIPYNTPNNLKTFANLSGTAPSCKQFDHWNTASDNSGTSYTNGQSVTLTAGLTLYAIYTNLTYAVTDGTMVGVASHSYSANPITCGNTLTITCAADGDHKGNPTVTATGTHGTITVVSATSVTIANVTSAIAVSISYAEKTNVTATWNANNGSVTGGGTTTQKEGSTFTFPNVTSTDCGTFLGWTNAANSAYSSTSGTPTPFYTAGSTTTLNENTQFYAVYSKVSDDAVSATLYAHDGNVNSITNAGYTNTTVTPTGISTTNTTNYKTKFDDVGDKVIFQLDGTPTSFSAAFQTPSSGTSGTSTIKLYESSSTSGPWTEITSTSITTSSTSATLSETRPAKFTQRILKLEMTSKGYNMMCGDITIVGLRAPINYTTNPGCVDWVLDAINVTTAPTKTTYDECEAFDPTGMAVTATMKENGNPSNTTTKDVAGYTWTPEQFLTPGNAVAVTISYTEKGVTRTTTQTVKVNDLPNYTITFHDGDGTTTWTQANHCDACDLDSRTGSLACGDYTFAGWSTSSTTYDDENATITTWVSGSYTPTANTHLYAVYRKGATPPAFTANCEGGTFYIYEANGNTHMAGRVNATPRAYTSEYWNNDGGTGCVACLDDGPDLTPFTFTKIAENTYKIQNSAGEYLRKYSSGNHPDFESTWYNEDNFKWVISAGTNGTWRFTNKNATDYALVKSGSYFDFQLASNVTALSSYYDLEIEPAASTVYQSNPNCASTYTITFNTHGGTFVQGNYAYATETTSGLSGTTTSKFPSATLSGCTFAGWKEGSVQEEVASSSEGDAPILIAADANMSVSSNKTYHAVYHYYDEDLEFDPVNGGTYHMYATISGTKHFCSGTPGTSYGILTSTTDCNDVVDVVITPGTGANVGKYKINIGGYDVSPELSGTGLKRGTFWWNIAEVDDNLYHITADGAESGRSLNYYSTSSAFTHYKDNGAGNTKDISFGRCRQHHWTSEPVLVPMVVLNSNSNIMVTSTNGQTLRSTTMLTVTATHYGETTKIYLSANVAGVGFLKSDGTALSSDAGGSYLQTDAEGELATSVYVTYAPTVTTDGIENVTITARDGHSPSPLSQTTRSAQVRHLPTKFIIAQKVGDDWYALPNNMDNNYTSSTTAVKLSSVNESTGVATFYSDVTDQFAYQLLASKGLDKKGMVFSSPVKSNYIIKANTTSSTSTIGLYAQSGWTGANVQYYEFTPATTDLVDYTIKNTFQNNYLGITTGAWGIGSTNNVRFFSIDQQPAPDITWYNDMLDADHATNKAENGVVTLPTGADPVSCNATLLPTFCGWKDGAIATYVTSAPTYVQAGDAATTDKRYYAVFKHATLDRWYTDCPTIYTITYTANGGTGSDHLEYTMTTTADAITVGEAGFSKEGCTFVGWTNPDDVDGTIITPGAGKITGLSGDITLNAVWIGTTTITGTVRLTTAAGEKVATSGTEVTISSTDFACATALRITYKDVTNDVTYGRSGTPSYTSSEFRLCNGSYGSADGSNIDLSAVSGSYNQSFSITYKPVGGANTLDEYQLKVEVLLKNTVIDTKTLSLYGRTLPASFAIAIKVGGSWYALPNNMASEGTYDPVLISVTEDANVLNWSAQGPSTVAYKMKDYTPNYSKLRFAANDANEYCLWASVGNSDGIRNYSASSTDNNYAWTVTETNADFSSYTMANLANTREALKIYNNKWEMYNTGGLSEIHFIPLTTVTPIDVTVMEWGADEIAVKTVANWTPSAITAQISGGSPSTVTKTAIGGDLYKLTGVGDLQGNPGEPLALNVTDGGAKQAIIQIPFIVAPVSPATSETKTEADLADLLVTAGYAGNRSDARNLTKNMDVIVRSGGTLSSSSSTSGTFQNVYIYPGGKADFSKDISIQNIYMRGGFSWLGGAYAHPQMNVASTASISGIGSTGHGIFYDLYLDNSIYYVFALPKDVAVTAITNEENGDDWDAWIKSYSGEGRTLSPKVSGWHYVTSGSIARGAGYEIAIKPRLNRPYGILRFPLLKSTAWSAETDCTPSVKGWGANNANVSDNNKGWNFIGNPFLTAYNNSTTPGSTPSGLIQTQTLVPSSVVPWDGKYVWSSSNVKYFTIPRYTEYEYDDVRAYPYKLDAFFPFFIQATGDGTLSFDDANRALKAPTRYVEETQREVIVDFILQNASGKQDLAGLTICDNYSADFDMNDKEKTIQNGNSVMKVYTMVGEYRTAFNSLPEAAAAQPIPVGYIAPAAGNYSFSLQEGDFSQVEHVWLTDYTESSTVDLLNGIPYQFETAAGTFNERFALNVILRSQQETPTGTGQMEAESDQPQKFIYQEKMYIMRGGVIYDATGKKVCEINK